MFSTRDTLVGWEVVEHDFNPSRGRQNSRFKASLVYKATEKPSQKKKKTPVGINT